jgi:hypothetical protein
MRPGLRSGFGLLACRLLFLGAALSPGLARAVPAGPAAAPPSPGPAATSSSNAAPTSSQDEPLEQYRERFKQGMDRYRAGALTEAIGYWEPIYRELGDQKGYRLAYNLGVAYAELGDATRAAERLQSFLAETEARRTRGDELAPIVLKEEADARARVAVLAATKGRIQVEAGTPVRAVQIDAGEPRLAGFVAWVMPGEHVITFGPGTPEAQAERVTVQAGETVEVPPPPEPNPPQPPTKNPRRIEPSPPPVVRQERDRPFSFALVGLSGTLAVAAGVTSVLLENQAFHLNDEYNSELQGTRTISQDHRSKYNSARTLAYGAVGTAAGLGVLTAALATWYFFGGSERDVILTPGGIAGRF